MGGQILSADAPFLIAQGPVTLVGGGDLAEGDLDLALAHAPTLVAVDGGAGTVLSAGHIPQVVIGDMDSIGTPDAERLSDRLRTVEEQDSTDFDKALRSVEAPLFLAVGFTGARIDHELAAFHTLVTRPEKRCVVIGNRDIVLGLTGVLELSLPVGTRLSLFPMAEVAGTAEGLRWPIDGLVFHPSRRIGTSNQTVASRVRIGFEDPGMLLILPRAALPSVLSALLTDV